MGEVIDASGAPIATATGSGPAIVNTLQVPEGVARPFMWLLAGLLSINFLISIAALVISLGGTAVLMAEAGRLNDKSSDLDRWLFESSYWEQRVEIAAEKQGIKLPNPPQKPKE